MVIQVSFHKQFLNTIKTTKNSKKIKNNKNLKPYRKIIQKFKNKKYNNN